MLFSKCFWGECMWQLWKNFKGWWCGNSKGRTIRKLLGVGAGEVQKNYSRKGKLNEKIFMHLTLKKILMLWPKKNSYKEFDNEKYYPRLEIPHPLPPYNFSNGPSLTSATVEFPISDHPKCQGLVVAYGRSSLTGVGPQLQGRNF